MLRVTILTANLSKKDVLSDPFKKFSFNISKKLLFSQPYLYTKACSTVRSSNDIGTQFSENYKFSYLQPDQLILPQKFSQSLKSFNNSIYKRKEKKLVGTFNNRNKKKRMLSIKDSLLNDSLLKKTHSFKKSFQHTSTTFKHCHLNFKYLNLAENPARKCNDKVLLYNSKNGKNSEDKKSTDDEKPNMETLLKVQHHLNENMPKLLSEKHDYSIYHRDVEFVNNWSSEKSYNTVGHMQYRLEMTKLKFYVHVRMTSVKVTLLRTSVDQSDACVKVRWRISGIPHSATIRQLFEADSQHEVQDEWLDGFSTFYVRNDGLIWRHVMDKISPEESPAKEGLIEKLARGISLSS